MHYEGVLLSFRRDKESWDIKTQERIEGQGARSAVADRLSTIWVLSFLLASVLGAFGIYEQLAAYLRKLPLKENSMTMGQSVGNLKVGLIDAVVHAIDFSRTNGSSWKVALD